jgi:hypothetical protein
MTLVKVRCKGLSDVRVMSKADLAAAGVEVESQLKWDRTNLHTVHIDGMSERLEEILTQEGTFTIEEVDEETGKTVKTIVKGSAKDDTGQTVVDKSQTAPTGPTGRGRST